MAVMSSSKAELRADVIHEVGVRFDDQLEGAKAESCRFDGAKQALMQAARKVEEHLVHVDKDVKAGKLEDLHQAEREKKRILECAGILRNLAVTAEVSQHVARGKVEALEQVVKGLKAAHEHERARAAQLKAAEVMQTPAGPLPQGARIPGIHPGMTIKEQRLAEEAAEKAAQEAQALPEAQDADVVPIKPTPAGGRKRKK